VEKYKILFIAFIESIHTERWLKQLSNRNDLEIHIISSNILLQRNINFSKNIIQHFPFPFNFLIKKINFLPSNKNLFKSALVILYNKIYTKDRYSRFLKDKINSINPDLIHTLETQYAGYLLLDVRKRYFSNIPFPKWWHTNWGSDFYLFSNFPSHKEKIINLLKFINYYSCESARDNLIAKKLGYLGEAVSTYPNTGGFDIDFLKNLVEKSPITSHRKIIMVKGYQGWAGRSLFILAALQKIHLLLKEYEIKIFSNPRGEDVKIASELLKYKYNLNIEILPKLSHNEMLTYFSKSRLYIGSSISDGISTSFLESLATGCFPLQSNTSSAEEWAEHGVNALFFDPEDPNDIANCIEQAINNEKLLDSAALINYEITKNRLDNNILLEMTNQTYNNILNNKN
jgi:glycosyltransferase involved in cell wall biosynthesis